MSGRRDLNQLVRFSGAEPESAHEASFGQEFSRIYAIAMHSREIADYFFLSQRNLKG